jgi:glycosyltransferase involved in cell wall biosynthesis
MGQKSKKYSKLPEKTMIYIGGLNEERNIIGLVRVLSLIHKKYSIDVNLAIYGKGSEEYITKIKLAARKLNVLDNVLIGYVTEAEIPSLLQQAEIGLFLLTDDDLSHSWGEPIKFFEYAAAGLPVVMSDLPAKRRLIETFKNGYVVNFDDEEAIADKCWELLRDPLKRKKIGEAGRRCFQKSYHWETLEPIITEILNSAQVLKNIN